MSGAVFLIFGATGDLAKRKLFPAFHSLYREGKLGHDFAVIGLARRPRTNEQFRQDVKNSINEFSRYKVRQDDDWAHFLDHFEYQSLDIHNVDGFRELKTLTEKMDEKFDTRGNRLFYLALAPKLFGDVSHNIKKGAFWNHMAGIVSLLRNRSGTIWLLPDN